MRHSTVLRFGSGKATAADNDESDRAGPKQIASHDCLLAFRLAFSRGHCLRKRVLPPQSRAAPGGQYADITAETAFGFAPRVRAANP